MYLITFYDMLWTAFPVTPYGYYYTAYGHNGYNYPGWRGYDSWDRPNPDYNCKIVISVNTNDYQNILICFRWIAINIPKLCFKLQKRAIFYRLKNFKNVY